MPKTYPLKIYALVLFPLYPSAIIFFLVHSLVSVELLHQIVEKTQIVFRYTSISAAYEETLNDEFLYYWLYTLCFIPLIPVVVFIWFKMFEPYRDLNGPSRSVHNPSLKSVVSGCGFVAITLFFCLGTVGSYTGDHFRKLFPSNALGVFPYSIAFYMIVFFGILPATKLFLVVRRLFKP